MKEAVYNDVSASRTTMRSAVITAPQQLAVSEVAVPEPGPDQVLIKLEGCGVCSSNIPPWEGREWFNYPMSPGALGHEGWGEIVKVGESVADLSVGIRVAFLSNNSYAEYDLAQSDSVVPIPDSLQGKPFPGEPLGCAMNIFRRSCIGKGDTVAIVGIGFLGALLTQLASKAGARVIALARKPSILRLAASMGAAETVLMDDHYRVIEAVKQMTDQKFCDVVIEATGKQWPLDLSAELTRERGRLIIAGYHQDGLRQVNMQLWNWRGIDVINAHEREQWRYTEGIRDAVRAVESGLINPDPLYTHTFPLEQLDQALEMTRERPDGFIKALVTM
jgi:threonine dehydrogenase-like Zn-dependent dehydrogenase